MRSTLKSLFLSSLRQTSSLNQIQTINKPIGQNAIVRFMSKDSDQVAPLSIKSKTKPSKPDAFASVELSETKTIQHFDNANLFQKYPPLSLSSPRQAWVESLDTDNLQRDLITLHPDVWGVRPRIDVLWANIDWQKRYRTVLYNDVKDRYDLHEGPRPWGRKGGGRARHRSTASPLWIQGGKAHGPRGPRTDFYMLPYIKRVTGLIHCLSAKFAQDDVHIVKNLDIPSDDPDYIEKMIDERGWGISCLFVDKDDIFPRNLTAATETVFHANMMPVYGLNVYSMLKHKTLILTVDAVQHLEEKILYGLCRIDRAEKVSAGRSAGPRMT